MLIFTDFFLKNFLIALEGIYNYLKYNYKIVTTTIESQMSFYRKKKLSLLININYPMILFLFIIFIYFLNAIFISRNVFSNHVFWLLNEASQLLHGYSPYKQIVMLYGIGTPIINAFSLYIFGNNIFSIFLISNIFYFLSIFFTLLIAYKLKFSFIDNLFLILILINIHPIPEVPWSSSFVYLPIILSLYFILENKKINFFFSGICLALACLVRETVLISATIIFFFIIYESIFKHKNLINLKFYILGFIFPLATFVIYMFISSNYLIWKELIYQINSWQTLINLGYYINIDITPLRKFYLLFLVPFRELFLVFVKSIQYFWFNWLLIFTSYFCSLLIFFRRIIKNNNWKEDEIIKYRVSLVSIYSLSLIIQNIHVVTISRVASGSIIGILIFYYLFIKIIQNNKIRFISYVIILFLLLFYSHGVSSRLEDQVSGRLYKLYSISFENLKNNPDLFFVNKNILDQRNVIPEFKHMNYDQSIHQFYNNIKKVCEELRLKKEIQYSDNQTMLWELSYFCKTKPKYYYIATMSEFHEQNFKKSGLSKEYNSNINNTIQFYVSNNLNLKKTTYFDVRGFKQERKIKNFQILFLADLKKDYPALFKEYKSRYFFITQNNQ